MKKVKGGVRKESLDDARVRFKHLSLLQDYQQLQKETEVARRRLRIVTDKKLTLESEVRFLRQRYNFLLRLRVQSHRPKQGTVLPHKLKAIIKNAAQEKNNTVKGAQARPPVPKFHSTPTARVNKKREIVPPPLPKLSLSIDLNQNIASSNVQGSTSRNLAHQLDLNQIANDEDDFQTSAEPSRIEAGGPFVKGLIDEQLNDMKLSACRSIKNASSNRAGKRKISWQDPVALRV